MFQITRHVLEFLKCHPVELEENYGKKQANLRTFRNVSIRSYPIFIAS